MINEASLGEYVTTQEDLPQETRQEVISRIVGQIEKGTEKQRNSVGHILYDFKKYDPHFDLTKSLTTLSKPIVEVGGPTNNGFYRESVYADRSKLLISNITPGQPIQEFNPESNAMEVVRYEGEVDRQFDATDMPFDDDSIGALYANSFPVELNPLLIKEAHRVLIKDNGLLILEGLHDDALEYANSLGFELVEELQAKPDTDEKKRYGVLKVSSLKNN